MDYNTVLDDVIFDTKTYLFNFENTAFNLITEHKLPQIMRHTTEHIHLHVHKYYELFSVTSGFLSVAFENIRKTVSANDILIVPPGTKHSVDHESSSSVGFDINFIIYKNSLNSSIDLYSALKAALSSPYIILRHKPGMIKLLSKATAAASDNRSAYKAGVYLYDFLTDVLYSSRQLPHTNDEEKIFATQASDRTMQIHRILNMTYREKLSFSYIAEKLHISTRQLNRFIQKIYGCTYTQKITAMRMEEALVLLENSKFPSVTKIAEYLGYDSKATFKKTFKNFYGYTVDDFLNNK